MFNNLKKLNNGRIKIKMLAVLLVITLTSANFILLGSYMGEAFLTHATDTGLNDQNSNTNVENVKFNVYVEKIGQNTVNKDINCEDLILGMSVKVENGGYFTEGKIELEKANFKIKDNENITNINLNSIQSGDGVTKEIYIVPIRDEEFNLELLNMISKLKLTGKYTNNKGKTVDVESTKNVQVIWDSQNITEENNPIILTQEVVTNKIYNIDGEDKKVVQLLIKSGIKDNSYPIKNTKLELDVPILEENSPEKVIVSAYSMEAINGKSSIDFGTKEEGKAGQWTYNTESNKINIELANNPDENNIINWRKNVEDEFMVTYVYDKDIDISDFSSTINSTIELYQSENTSITKSSEIKNTDIKEMGNAITVDGAVSNTVYKGNIKIDKETEYNIKWSAKIGYAEIADDIKLENEQEEINTIYRETYINKEELIKLLGEDGSIVISYLNSEGEAVEAETINKDTQADENGIITIKYDENEVKTLYIETSKPLSEGVLNISHKKVILPGEIDKNQILNTTKIDNNVKLTASREEVIVEGTKNIEIPLENTNTEVAFGIDKVNLSTLQNNNINITATLKNSSLKYDLFKNPIIEIVIPKEIQKIEIKNISILNENGLTVEKNEEYIDAEGNKVIKITLNGEQKDYSNADTQVLINADIEIDKLLPTLEKTVTLKCTNEKETIYADPTLNYATDSKKIHIVAEEGIITASKVLNYNENEPEILALKNEEKTGLLDAESDKEVITTIKNTIINNTEKDLLETTVIGKVTDNSNIEAKIKSPITIQNGTVYYTQDAEVSAQSTWTDEFSENSTGYKIVFEKLDNKQIVEFSYEIVLPQNIGNDKKLELNYSVYSEAIEVNSPKIVLSTVSAEKEEKQEETKEEPKTDALANDVMKNDYLEMSVVTNPATTEIVQPGQEVIYNITVKNLKEAENVTDPDEGVMGEYGPFDGVDTNQEETELVDPELEDIEENENDDYLNTVNGSRIMVNAELTDGITVTTASITVNGETKEKEYNSQNISISKYLEKDQTINIVLKAKIEDETTVSNVLNKISSLVKLPNETGFDEDEEKTYVGELNTEVRHNLKEYKKIEEINIPEKLSLNLGETKSFNIEIKPEDASLDKVQKFIEDEQIAKFNENGLIEAVSAGYTTITVKDDDSDIIKYCNIEVIDPSQPNDTEGSDDLGDIEIKDDEEDPEKPEDPEKEKVYIISGTAWLDENEDGMMNSEEKKLDGISVKLKDNLNNEYVKDENKNILTAVTDKNGEYKFENIKLGSYSVEFEYNKNTYKLTPVSNKDSVAHLVTTNQENIITTEVINVTNQDIKNINIGLVLNPIFDLQLDKYITKVTVQNSAGTKVYNYNKEQLAKVDISAKKMSGSTVIIEYAIAVSNKGAVPGYAKNIVDYLSQELKFNSEMNTNWYQGTDGNLYSLELENQLINPGETKEVKLILTKTMTDTNTGLVNNSAEIYRSYNEYALEDVNSSPDNKQEKENDYSKADIIITVSTGGALLYIGIVLGSMLIIGLGIYLINKKVINKSENI